MPSHAVPPRFRQILIHGGKNGNWYKLGFMDKIDQPTYLRADSASKTFFRQIMPDLSDPGTASACLTFVAALNAI